MQPGDGWPARADAAKVAGLVSGLVEKAVERDIKELATRDKNIGQTAEAALALSLARRIDDEGNSATSVSMNAGRLLEALAAMRALVPDAPKAMTPLDEIRNRRDKKLKRAAG